LPSLGCVTLLRQIASLLCILFCLSLVCALS
jgi:hypothetical protein